MPSLLRRAKSRELRLHTSSAAVVELALVMRSRGLSEGSISGALEATELMVARHAKPAYAPVTLRNCFPRGEQHWYV